MEKTTASNLSLWNVFRLVFVCFSLFLMRDAFYRWDGFQYYASFLEFIPSVALITILWSIVAAIVAVSIWMLLKVIRLVCALAGWQVSEAHGLVLVIVFTLLGAASWVYKVNILKTAMTSFQFKATVFFGVLLLSLILTWVFRDKCDKFMTIVQEHIYPLVWLFSIWFLLAVPIVVYHTLGGETPGGDEILSQKEHQPFTSGAKKPNIVLVTYDSLTSRDMSLYGYHLLTTPFISEWAKKASVFKRFQADSNWTGPTIATIATGKKAWSHQSFHEGSKPVKHEVENIANVLRDNGYYNLSFAANYKASPTYLGMTDSFDVSSTTTEFITTYSLPRWSYVKINMLLNRFFGGKIVFHYWLIHTDFVFRRILNILSPEWSTTEVPPRKVFDKFLEVYDKKIPEPYFVWIHVYPPHYPYLPPEQYVGIFDESATARSSMSVEKLMIKATKLQNRFEPFPEWMQKKIDIYRAAYDEFIRYCDKDFEVFVTELEKRNMLSNTVMILSADHGESFEHDYFTHASHHLYEQVTHIPLVIKEPGQNETRVIDQLTEQVDLSATILDLAGAQIPSWIEGRSLIPLMRGESLPPKPIFSMQFQSNFGRGQKITNGTLAVWDGEYKLIHYIGKKKSLLFNLEQDPDELNNLFEEEPETGRRLLELINENLDKANKRVMQDN